MQLWLGVTTSSIRERTQIYQEIFASLLFPSGSHWHRRSGIPYDLLVPLQSLRTPRQISKVSVTVDIDLEVGANFDDSEEVVIDIAMVVSSVGVRRVVNYLF
jgi:hypothetical protein